LVDLVKSGFVHHQDYVKGVNKFLTHIPDLVNDYPKITEYLSGTLFTLKEQKVLKYSDLIWHEEKKSAEGEDEDMLFVEQYYHLMAYLLLAEYQKNKNLSEVVSIYTSDHLNKVFTETLKPHILEDGLFSEIESNVASQSDEKAGQAIAAMLSGDSEKVKALTGLALA
jgi:hypothetical protein